MESVRASRQAPALQMTEPVQLEQEPLESFLHHAGLTDALHTYIASENETATQDVDMQHYLSLSLIRR
jgi:hypothetical protein